MIHLLVPAIFGIFAVLQLKMNNKSGNKTAFTAGFVIIFLLLAFRNISVGFDTISYVNIFFVKYGESSWSTVFASNNEWGFAILCKLTYMICPHPNFFFAVVAIICIIPFIYMYSNYVDEYPIISFMIFIAMDLYAMLFSGLRQSIAIAIMCLAYRPLTERKLCKYLLLTIIASMFHASAIVALLFYFIYAIPLRRESYPIAITILLIAFIFRVQIINVVVKIMSMLNDRYASYRPVETGAYLSILVYFVILIIFYFFNPVFSRKNTLKGEELSRKYVNVFAKDNVIYDKKLNLMFTLLFIQMFASVHYGAARISMYLVAWLPIMISEYFTSYQDVKRNEDKLIFAVGFFAVFLYKFISSVVIQGALGTTPYIPFWG